MQELFNYKNVFFDSMSDYGINQINEREYCQVLFRNLESKLSGLFQTVNFFVLFSHNPEVVPESVHINFENKVLVWFSEESGKFPEYLSNHYHLIFKSYIQEERLNIYSNPLGYVNEFQKVLRGRSDKSTTLFFSGNLNSYRREIYELFFFRKFSFLVNLKKISLYISKLFFVQFKIKNLSSKKDSSFILFSNGFKSGLPYSKYITIMEGSKYVLCPRGFESNETFRHFEALHNDCIIISGRMPSVDVYHGHPFLIYESVDELKDIIDEITNRKYDEPYLLEMHRDFYKRKLSIESTSARIAAICSSRFNVFNHCN